MGTTLHTAAERPDLWERGIESADVWPEYNLHGDVLNQWWGHLDEELADFQFVLYDDEPDAVLAEGHTGPLWWDGDDATLPPGIDAALEQVFARARAGEPVNTLCALAAETPRTGRARGMAEQILGAMSELARRNGLERVIAPVRPSAKHLYPLAPIERYVRGGARTASCSTRGCGCTSGSVPGCPRRCRSRCGSPAPSPSGSRGRRWRSPSPGRTCSPRGSRRSTWTGRPTGAPTGSPTCG